MMAEDFPHKNMRKIRQMEREKKEVFVRARKIGN
jgi:hypothetical protein